MNKEDWKTKIEEQIKFDHDYIPSFQTTIQILSEMLEERDRVYSQYLEDGARPVVEFISDRGASNLKQNPLLRQWQEINTLCLSYLRDLGLTAAGLRKLQGQIPKEKFEGPNALDQLLKDYHLQKFVSDRDKASTLKVSKQKKTDDPEPPAEKTKKTRKTKGGTNGKNNS